MVIPLDVTATGAGSGVPIDQSYWLGARVQAGKIIFLASSEPNWTPWTRSHDSP